MANEQFLGRPRGWPSLPLETIAKAVRWILSELS
jgi:hypothetical protein